MKVLIAEDDSNTRKGLQDILETEGYETVTAEDGTAAIELFKTERPDFLCLDIMMPGKDGYEVCRSIRKIEPDIPIIFISAKSEEIDKVLGLELGADDFIVKPFGVKEVVARIRAVTRRCLSTGDADPIAVFAIGDLQVSPGGLRASRGGTVIDLSLRDVTILQTLQENPGQVLTRNMLFKACWGVDSYGDSRALDQHIAKLRKRIELNPRKPVIIQTVHGTGYRYDP